MYVHKMQEQTGQRANRNLFVQLYICKDIDDKFQPFSVRINNKIIKIKKGIIGKRKKQKRTEEKGEGRKENLTSISLNTFRYILFASMLFTMNL